MKPDSRYMSRVTSFHYIATAIKINLLINSICDGLLVGLGISILVGPLFFGLIQLSVERGFWAGIFFAMGIWVSDLLYVRVVQLGLGYIGDDRIFQLIFGIGGSVILILFGVGVFFGPLKRGNLSVVRKRDALGYFLKGAAINVFNPAVLLIWVGLLGNMRSHPMNEQWVFVASLLSVVAIADIIKAAFAARIGGNLDESKLINMKKGSGVIIGIFGLILLVRTIMSLQHHLP